MFRVKSELKQLEERNKGKFRKSMVERIEELEARVNQLELRIEG
jgi:hypothetical protein